MVARWADFTFDTDDGTATFPGLSVGLDHYCLMAQSDEAHFLIQADGARSFNPEFNQVIFWRLKLKIPYSQLASGLANVTPSESYLYACPGFPSEDAWSSGAVEQCTAVMLIGAGTIDFNLDRFEQYQELSGYVDLELYR